MDLGKGSKSRHKKEKKKHSPGEHKRRRTRSIPNDDGEKMARKRDYATALQKRKQKAQVAREKEDEENTQRTELKKSGLQEKERLNQLFAIYSAQQGSAYRRPARVVKPIFPNLPKSSPNRNRKIPSNIEGGFLPNILSTGKAETRGNSLK
ncbi:uncharacterized protein LOC116610144 [Nematostella vectensis]|uniref:uncharacterized protein LOC116610144 n=1 Tax=Nematostella vectensis TaxID=45351 RepID=UPI0020771D2C|nr:uncharacterized protein LOC116610144 [Nematostella vectensis]